MQVDGTSAPCNAFQHSDNMKSVRQIKNDNKVSAASFRLIRSTMTICLYYAYCIVSSWAIRLHGWLSSGAECSPLTCMHDPNDSDRTVIATSLYVEGFLCYYIRTYVHTCIHTYIIKQRDDYCCLMLCYHHHVIGKGIDIFYLYLIIM